LNRSTKLACLSAAGLGGPREGGCSRSTRPRSPPTVGRSSPSATTWDWHPRSGSSTCTKGRRTGNTSSGPESRRQEPQSHGGSAHWQPVLTTVLSSFVGHRLLPQVLPPPLADIDWDSELLEPLLNALEMSLRVHPFLTGETITIADFSVAGMMTYFRAAHFLFGKTPCLSGWYGRIEALEAWRSTETPLWRADRS